MKKIIIVLMLLTIKLSAQPWVPLKVDQFMQDSATLSIPIDTVKFENYIYIFKVQGDTNFIRWTLIDKKKLYTDYWKGAGVAYFSAAFVSIGTLPYLLPTDKILHLGAGMVIGGGVNYITYRCTKKKWLSFGIGAASGALIGFGKEYIWDKNMGGTVSIKDAVVTSLGSAIGSFGVRIALK